MAERRMISKKIVDTDLFLDMPATSRLLYYDLLIRADDDGFVGSPKKITKVVGASEDDLKLLIVKQFIIPFESGVCVIKDWKIHNYIRKDRAQETQYIDEKRRLSEDEHGAYLLCQASGQPNVSQMSVNRSTEERIGKDRVGKVNLDSHKKSNLLSDRTSAFEKFWSAYPNKKGKVDAEKIFYKINPSEALLKKILRSIEMQKDSRQWHNDNGKYIPYPANWLQKERWEDEVPKKAESSYDLNKIEEWFEKHGMDNFS